jgi:hypothetical protein
VRPEKLPPAALKRSLYQQLKPLMPFMLLEIGFVRIM